MKFPNISLKISLKKRLLIANFLMVLVPILLVGVVGSSLMANLKHSSKVRNLAIMLLSSEKTPMLSVHYAVSDLYGSLEKNHKLKKILKSCQLLEAQKISILLKRGNEIVYLTEGANAAAIERKFSGYNGTIEIWNGEIFLFRHTSTKGLTAFAVGDISLMRTVDHETHEVKKFVMIVIYAVLIFVIIVIILLGRYLASLIAEQILNSENKRKELIAGISHDLATPLTSLKGYISGIRDGIANTPQKQQHYLEMMLETTDNMTQLVDNLFTMTKLDLGRIEFHVEPVAIYDYFADFIQEKSTTFADSGLNLTLSGDKTNAKILIDYAQFARVVENILSNSLKYKRSDIVNVEINLQELSGKVKISFIDDGAGVDAENLPRLFDSFYRTDKARSNVSKGSGLGLAIVKQIITALNGKVYAEQSKVIGLTIIIILPVVKG